jgi:hypothetical protein
MVLTCDLVPNSTSGFRKKRAAIAVSTGQRSACPRAFRKTARNPTLFCSRSSPCGSQVQRQDQSAKGHAKRSAQAVSPSPRRDAPSVLAAVSVSPSAAPRQRWALQLQAGFRPLIAVPQQAHTLLRQPAFQGVRMWREVRVHSADALSLNQSMLVALGMAFRLKCTASL